MRRPSYSRCLWRLRVMSWAMRYVAIAIAVLACCACGSAAHTTERKVVHVSGPATNLPVSDSCFLVLRSDVVGGGWATYCMKRFINDPGPNVTVLSSGEL